MAPDTDHSNSQSSVGLRMTYKGGDQENYSISEVEREGRPHGINTMGQMDRNKIMNELRAEDTQRQIDDRYKHEPGYAAIMHGNEPSKGAKIDASIAQEEAEIVEKKNQKTDSIPGKKMEHHSSKNEWKQGLEG
ncbi:hypothetical protein SODALDRAFT_326182 [Sodiomyces alkalinus F11]|uniref:Uncharacterized protein n=1 Tax=Sodiomyces alkalinus (strain CBS 110278 / VKM F-3762 / F11) TaxID=1314773 RepID=A0A3N2Q5T6_SODAK|nr:hypothetical protein SODALDRAFT_326182 [Sodiomyces alkalinus F11]ROT42018.1 hypothetical protein SODALDRAFT_326182 [Sodiomyces alkalinus F11]